MKHAVTVLMFAASLLAGGCCFHATRATPDTAQRDAMVGMEFTTTQELYLFPRAYIACRSHPRNVMYAKDAVYIAQDAWLYDCDGKNSFAYTDPETGVDSRVAEVVPGGTPVKLTDVVEVCVNSPLMPKRWDRVFRFEGVSAGGLPFEYVTAVSPSPSGEIRYPAYAVLADFDPEAYDSRFTSSPSQ